ncbi:protein of unknown function [Pseudomonas sp. JV551A1]|nr:protein of unknown function [Pseudomonas sp. JV551A1]
MGMLCAVAMLVFSVPERFRTPRCWCVLAVYKAPRPAKYPDTFVRIPEQQLATHSETRSKKAVKPE